MKLPSRGGEFTVINTFEVYCGDPASEQQERVNISSDPPVKLCGGMTKYTVMLDFDRRIATGFNATVAKSISASFTVHFIHELFALFNKLSGTTALPVSCNVCDGLMIPAGAFESADKIAELAVKTCIVTVFWVYLLRLLSLIFKSN